MSNYFFSDTKHILNTVPLKFSKLFPRDSLLPDSYKTHGQNTGN